jgi:hypothetical protein
MPYCCTERERCSNKAKQSITLKPDSIIIIPYTVNIVPALKIINTGHYNTLYIIVTVFQDCTSELKKK